MPKWDAGQYLKFRNERTQPAFDLVSRIEIAEPVNVVDIGCGPGNSTSVLEQRWPDANISGFDSSPEMLDMARDSSRKVNWFQADAANWEPDINYDVIFSNAALQWVPDHGEFLPRMIGCLNEGGVLAVQMPAHYNSQLHQSLLAVAKSPEWCDLTEDARSMLSMKSPAYYYDLLEPLLSKLELWETEYIHVMDSTRAIMEWFRGTGLRPFMEALSTQDKKEKFEQALYALYEAAYPLQNNSKVLLPFRRFFILAHK